MHPVLNTVDVVVLNQALQHGIDNTRTIFLGQVSNEAHQVDVGVPSRTLPLEPQPDARTVGAPSSILLDKPRLIPDLSWPTLIWALVSSVDIH